MPTRSSTPTRMRRSGSAGSVLHSRNQDVEPKAVSPKRSGMAATLAAGLNKASQAAEKEHLQQLQHQQQHQHHMQQLHLMNKHRGAAATCSAWNMTHKPNSPAREGVLRPPGGESSRAGSASVLGLAALHQLENESGTTRTPPRTTDAKPYSGDRIGNAQRGWIEQRDALDAHRAVADMEPTRSTCSRSRRTPDSHPPDDACASLIAALSGADSTASSPFFPQAKPISGERCSSNLASRRDRMGLSCKIPEKRPQKNIRMLDENEKIFDLYYWDEVLQEDGDGGKVVVCKPKGVLTSSSCNYVMKIRSKESLLEQFHEEEFRKAQFRMLNFPPHVGVMPLHEVLEDDDFYYIVMDQATGGSFFASLLNEFKDGIMPQRAVKSLMREILEAVSHVHKQGMLHRDIKPDNLVMQFHDDPKSPTGKVKKVMLIDFDHADPDWSPIAPPKQHCCYGTLRFNAPETLLGEYVAASDLYSVGCILYMLMTGKLPYSDEFFDEELEKAQASPNSRRSWMESLHENMKSDPIDWTCSPWPERPDCMEFCAALLAFDHKKRIPSAEEALNHKWFRQANVLRPT